MDYFTKFLICVPLRDKSALSVARALVQHLYLMYGWPDIQVSDQGKEFQNELMKNISQILGIHQSRTCAYRPSSNGCVEQVHRIINSISPKHWTKISEIGVRCPIRRFRLQYRIPFEHNFLPVLLVVSTRTQTTYWPGSWRMSGKLCLPTPWTTWNTWPSGWRRHTE